MRLRRQSCGPLRRPCRIRSYAPETSGASCRPKLAARPWPNVLNNDEGPKLLTICSSFITGGASSLFDGARWRNNTGQQAQIFRRYALAAYLSTCSFRIPSNLSRFGSLTAFTQMAARGSLPTPPDASRERYFTPSKASFDAHLGTIAEPIPAATRLIIVCFRRQFARSSVGDQHCRIARM